MENFLGAKIERTLFARGVKTFGVIVNHTRVGTQIARKKLMWNVPGKLCSEDVFQRYPSFFFGGEINFSHFYGY